MKKLLSLLIIWLTISCTSTFHIVIHVLFVSWSCMKKKIRTAFKKQSHLNSHQFKVTSPDLGCFLAMTWMKRKLMTWKILIRKKMCEAATKENFPKTRDSKSEKSCLVNQSKFLIKQTPQHCVVVVCWTLDEKKNVHFWQTYQKPCWNGQHDEWKKMKKGVMLTNFTSCSPSINFRLIGHHIDQKASGSCCFCLLRLKKEKENKQPSFIWRFFNCQVLTIQTSSINWAPQNRFMFWHCDGNHWKCHALFRKKWKK